MCTFIFSFSFLMNEQQKCKTAQQHFVLKKYNTQKYSFLIYSTYSFIWLIFNKSIGEQCVHCTMYKEEGYFNYLVLIPCNYGTSNPLGRLECPPLEFGLVVYTGSDGEEQAAQCAVDLLPAPDGVQAEDVVGQVRLYSPASQTSINLLEIDQQSSLVFLLR